VARTESAHENFPIGIDRLGWSSPATDPVGEKRSRS